MDYLKGAWQTGVSELNRAGRDISAAGRSVSQAAQRVQGHIKDGVNALDSTVDHAVDSFEQSRLGDNAVGHALGKATSATTHFTGGVVKGATGLATGVVGLAGTAVRVDGGAVQYATSSAYRHDVNHEASHLAHEVAAHPTAIPLQLYHGALAAFKHDPADFAGQAVGVIGTTVLTAGAGSAVATAGRGGVIAQGADALAEAGEAGQGLEIANDAQAATSTGRTAAEATESAARPEVTEPGSLPQAEPSAGYDRLGDHMTEVGKIKSGIVKGTHSRDDFYKLMEGRGVVSEEPVPNMPGVSVAKYRTYKATQEGLTSQLRDGEQMKTLFDPDVWKRDDIVNLARNVFGDRPATTPDGPITAQFRGQQFVGHVRGGQMQNFGVEPSAP